jgi:uncharacterized membrane protein
MANQGSRLPLISGLTLAATGVAHFIKPTAFDSLTAQAFPRNTRRFTYINGGLETALGVAIAVPQARNLAAIGGVGYFAYLGVNLARNRR